MTNAPLEPSILLRDLVRDRPRAIGVLDTYRIDWCCGARRTLAEACATAGAPLPAVLEALRASPEATPASQLPSFAELGSRPVTEIVRHLLDHHHAFTRAEGPRLRALASKVAKRHGAAHTELSAVEELVHGLFDELDQHMLKEENVLFPYLEALARAPAGQRPPAPPFGTVARPIQAMMGEHEDAGRLLDELVRVTDAFRLPAEACGSWTALYEGLRAHDADLRRHVWIENEILFPSALALEQRARN